jgi:serine phosphatase RsbU (regulator of sigma subunit)
VKSVVCNPSNFRYDFQAAMKLLPFQRERAVATAPPTAADFPPLSGADIAGVIQGKRVGGDLYGFLRANPCRVVFGLLDVAGSYEENQTIVDATRQTFLEMGCKSFADPEVNEADAMMEFCLALNLTVRRAASGVRSCPAFVGCYNEVLGTVCYANAGHTPGLLRDPSGVTELPATGLPLGLFAASTYEAPFVALQPGSSLLLVSRGVVEAAYKREEFGLNRVKEQFQRASRENAREIATAILGSVQQFLRMPPTHNDVTALALVRSEPAPVAVGV